MRDRRAVNLAMTNPVPSTTGAQRHHSEGSSMKKVMMFAAGVLALAGAAAVQPAQAGCLSGAAVGGVAGHFAGHHGLIGAGVGCAIGHHRAVMRERDRGYYSDRRW
jgi:hypothetical protein